MKDFKFFKKQWKFYKFLKILKEILRFFEKIFKIYRNFRENLGKILENFGNMHFNGAPKASAIIKKISHKINWNLQNFESFHELWEYSLFTK